MYVSTRFRRRLARMTHLTANGSAGVPVSLPPARDVVNKLPTLEFISNVPLLPIGAVIVPLRTLRDKECRMLLRESFDLDGFSGLRLVAVVEDDRPVAAVLVADR